MSQATLRLDDLLRWSALGLHLARPWRVTLIGPVNAGKSSLINAVLGYQRALVSRQAGTTRDVLTGTTACAGWPVELSDTAGLRPGTSALEREGIERAQRQAAAADLRVVVTDLTRPWTREDQLWLEQLPTPRLVVHNKCDRLGPEGRGDRPPGILTSALHARGIGELVAGIAQQLVPECPPTGTAVPLLPAHVDALRVTRQALSAGQVAIATQTLTSLFTSPI
jgi:tRNA modification GTPase